MNELITIMNKLSDERVMVRKSGIIELKRYLSRGGGKVHLARLSLEYLSSYDPAWTIRNLARQALEMPLGVESCWEKVHAFDVSDTISDVADSNVDL